MPDSDNRIVQGGEVEIKPTLDDALQSAAPTSVTSLPSTNFAAQPYTLQDIFLEFLEHAYLVQGSRISIDILERIKTKNLISTPWLRETVKVLGPDFFKLGNLRYILNNQNYNCLVVNLEFSKQVPFKAFEAGLSVILGSEELARYFLDTDLAKAIGLDDSTRPVNTGDPILLQYMPRFKRMYDLDGGYLIPTNPYILLLASEPQYRRFLSLCLDERKQANEGPFKYLKPDIKQQVHLKEFAIFNETLIYALSDGGFLDLPTMVRVGHRYGVRDLKQYVDEAHRLNDTLNNVR